MKKDKIFSMVLFAVAAYAVVGALAGATHQLAIAAMFAMMAAIVYPKKNLDVRRKAPYEDDRRYSEATRNIK